MRNETTCFENIKRTHKAHKNMEIGKSAVTEQSTLTKIVILLDNVVVSISFIRYKSVRSYQTSKNMTISIKMVVCKYLEHESQC